jgi:hypothetical protein
MGTALIASRSLDLVLIQQPEQVFQLHQSAGGVVIDENFATPLASAGAAWTSSSAVPGSRQAEARQGIIPGKSGTRMREQTPDKARI